MTELEKLMLIQVRCACAVIKAISVLVERNAEGLDTSGSKEVQEIEGQLLRDIKEVMAA